MKKPPDFNVPDMATFKSSAPVKRMIERLNRLSKDKLIEFIISEWREQEILRNMYSQGIIPSSAFRENFNELPYVENPHIKKQIETKNNLDGGRKAKTEKSVRIGNEKNRQLEKAIRDYFMYNGQDRKIGNKELHARLQEQFVSNDKIERKKHGKHSLSTFRRKVALIAAKIKRGE